MMKLGPSFPTVGTAWDHQGKSEISQIFISTSRSRIDFMQFAYVEDGQVVLSEKIGGGSGTSNLQTITFDYPSEYITRVNGCYLYEDSADSKYLCAITFHTNKSKYGMYGPGICQMEDFEAFDFNELIDIAPPDEFNYEVGGKFWGFFGTYKSNCIESIGLYMKPRPLANQSGANRPVLP